MRAALIALATLLILIGIGQLLAHTTRSPRPVQRTLTPAAAPGPAVPRRPSTPNPSHWLSTREVSTFGPAVERTAASTAAIRLRSSSAEVSRAPHPRERTEQPAVLRVPAARRAANAERGSVLELPIAPPED